MSCRRLARRSGSQIEVYGGLPGGIRRVPAGFELFKEICLLPVLRCGGLSYETLNVVVAPAKAGPGGSHGKTSEGREEDLGAGASGIAGNARCVGPGHGLLE